MSKINTGGPAFPIVTTETNEHGLVFPFVENGMTLRDYFAAKAMQAIIEADGIQYASNVTAHACFAYDQADAMIAARGDANG